MHEALGRHGRAGVLVLMAFASGVAMASLPAPIEAAQAAVLSGIDPGGSAMILRRLRLKANTAKPGKVNGKITVHGFINVNVPFSDFPGDVDAGGFTALVDGAGMSEALVWTGEECTTQVGKPGQVVIRCVSADKQRKAIFRPGSGVVAPNTYKFRFGGRRLGFPAPLNSNEVMVIIDTVNLAPVDTIGEVGSCSVHGTQSHVVICKETGIFVVP